MTGKQLKNSILQLAIQGKLVPQDPHDEPASELLKRIRKEKEQLVKTGKLKKKDLESTPIAEDEKPFEIPESWEWCRLRELASFNGGYAFKSINYVEKGSGTRVLRISDFSEQGIFEKTPVYYPSDVTLEKYTLTEGDIVMCMTGGTVGKTFHVNHLLESFYVNQRVADIKVSKTLSSKYVYQVIVSSYIQGIIAESKNSTNDNISAELINSFLIPLPPLSEQHRIVEKIEELMPLVEEYDKAQSELDKLNESLPEQLKKSILQQAIMGKLVPQDPNDEPASELLKRIHKEKENLVKSGALKKKDLITTPISDDEKPFDIPESWEWCRLGDLCEFLSRGKSPSYSDTPTNYPVYAQKCSLKSGGISLEQARFLNPTTISKWPEEFHLRTDDVLVNSTGTGTVCRTRLFDEKCLGKYPFTVPDSHVSVVRTFDFVDSAYVYFYLNSKINQDYWEDNLAGSTNQKELYLGVLADTPIPLPPFTEQQFIVAKIEELFNILK